MGKHTATVFGVLAFFSMLLLRHKNQLRSEGLKKQFGKHGLAEHNNQLKGRGVESHTNKHKAFHWKAV
jgi:hypothetical protein